MRKWVILGLVIFGIGLVLLMLTPGRAPLPRVAQDFLLPDLRGQVVRLSQLRGKVVFLNVWTTWCPPCRKEMPTMEVLYQRLKNEDFVMLAVSQDVDGRSTVVPYLQEEGFTFPVLLDMRGQVGHMYGVTGYPETFLIDRQGMLVYHHIGYNDWSRPAIEAALRRLIKQGVWAMNPDGQSPGEHTPLR